jgi:hypothetical protein
MYDVVPGALQRLREADIVSMAGLSVASLGQEYCRISAIHATKRQGTHLSGIVEVPDTNLNQVASTTISAIEAQQAIISAPGRYVVEVELRDRIMCNVTCSCIQLAAQSTIVCPHAAALLYHWLAHPLNFVTPPLASASSIPLPFERETVYSWHKDDLKNYAVPETKQVQSIQQTKPMQAQEASFLNSNTAEMLAQSGLSELRTLAREHGIDTNGLNKQQLVEAIVDILQQPEAIRRIAATLEKQQRQLLAALTLAGGSMNDEDLRGLFERFSLGGPGQLQNMLHILQSKALIVRATFNSSLQQRRGAGLSGSSLEVCWYVPSEVRAALLVTLPITPFAVEAGGDQNSASPQIRHVEPYSLLTDLLLIARALDGRQLESNGKNNEEKGRTEGTMRFLNPLPVDGSIAIPAPNGVPSTALLQALQAVIPRPLPFLRFAIRVLRLADILYYESDANETSRFPHAFEGDTSNLVDRSSERPETAGSRVMQQNRNKDDAGVPVMHALPNAAELLLGSTRTEVAHELFLHWLNRASYEELFDLQDEGLRLRCRATPLNQPALRTGELEIEIKDARQTLVTLLAQAPISQWINFSAFARFVYRLNPAFLQRRQRQFPSPHWWIELEEGRILHPAHFNDWMRAEGRYLTQLLQGPLHWWGICDLVFSPDERLLAFRITPLANSFLNGLPIEDCLSIPETSPIMDVSEVGDVLIPCVFANWPLIELIERFAEINGVHSAQLCYLLTPESLGEAFARGESPSVLLELLHSAAEYQHSIMPDSSLARLLVQLERRIASYGRVRLYTGASLLEVADQQVLRELSATTSFNEQLVRSIHPTLFILKKNAIECLMDELKRRGQVPLLHTSAETQFIAPRAEEQHGTK